MPNLQVKNIDVQKLKVHDKNPKQHSKKQITQIAKSITKFGFVSPILADEQFEIIAGHGRLAAAETLGFTQVPVIILSHFKTRRYTSVQLYSPYYCRRKPYSYILGSIFAASSRINHFRSHCISKR